MVSMRMLPPNRIRNRLRNSRSMVAYLSLGPRLADAIEQQAHGNFDNVKQAAREGDARHAAAALAHAHGHFADLVAGLVEQEDDFGLRVIVRVPVGKGSNNLSVGGAEPAGAVGGGGAFQPPDQ